MSSQGKISFQDVALDDDIKKTVAVLSDESFEDSKPMPSIPPPPLPNLEQLENSDGEKESYAIVLFDFESGVDEDLNLKVSFFIPVVKVCYLFSVQLRLTRKCIY